LLYQLSYNSPESGELTVLPAEASASLYGTACSRATGARISSEPSRYGGAIRQLIGFLAVTIRLRQHPQSAAHQSAPLGLS